MSKSISALISKANLLALTGIVISGNSSFIISVITKINVLTDVFLSGAIGILDDIDARIAR